MLRNASHFIHFEKLLYSAIRKRMLRGMLRGGGNYKMVMGLQVLGIEGGGGGRKRGGGRGEDV